MYRFGLKIAIVADVGGDVGDATAGLTFTCSLTSGCFFKPDSTSDFGMSSMTGFKTSDKSGRATTASERVSGVATKRIAGATVVGVTGADEWVACVGGVEGIASETSVGHSGTSS